MFLTRRQFVEVIVKGAVFAVGSSFLAACQPSSRSVHPYIRNDEEKAGGPVIVAEDEHGVSIEEERPAQLLTPYWVRGKEK